MTPVTNTLSISLSLAATVPHNAHHKPHSTPPSGHTDDKWRRRFFALKGPQLFYFRTAASAKPLAVLDLSAATVSASKTPLYSDGGSNTAADDGASDELWVLKLVLQHRPSGKQQSSHSKYKLGAPSKEMQVSLCLQTS